MFLPKHFAITDATEIARLLSELGAADLVTNSDDGLTSSFIPFVFVPDGNHGSLQGHLRDRTGNGRPPTAPRCS